MDISTAILARNSWFGAVIDPPLICCWTAQYYYTVYVRLVSFLRPGNPASNNFLLLPFRIVISCYIFKKAFIQ